MKRLFAALLLVAGWFFCADARLLSTAFGDDMVLQAYPQSAVLYGYSGSAGAKITVALDGGAVTATATAGADGRWEATLPATRASLDAVHSVAVSSSAAGDSPVTLQRVRFGEVFLCSGQSNMAFQLSRVANAAAEISKAAQYSQIRLAHVTQGAAATPQREPPAQVVWGAPTTATAADFSAVCILFGERMFELLKVPIGLVDNSVGGTYIEQWTPKEFLEKCPCNVPPKTFNSSDLWNALTAPLTGMRFRSQVWYQGEANVNNADCYGKCSFPQMINAWRSAWSRNGFIRPAGQPPTVVGHRGQASACPENTLPSQEVARRSGANWIEDDTQPSKDGTPFVLHDATVDRTTDGHGNIRDLTDVELKKLDAGIKWAPSFAGTRLPTLKEQLVDLRTRGGNLLMEIKGSHSKAECQVLADLIRAENMTERVFVQSFDIPSLQHMYEIAPEMPLGLLLSKLDSDPVAVARKLHLTGYHPVSSVVTKGLVDELHAAGISIFVWTPDTNTEWKALDAMGVDGIITNRPTELESWISTVYSGVAVEKPVWHPPTDGILTPFIFVQLHGYFGYDYYPGDSIAALRWAQEQVLTMPGVAMATAVDLGLPSGDIHPTDKQDVAQRLSLTAQHLVYGSTTVKYFGPEPAAVKVDSQPPSAKVTLVYSAESIGSGLDVRQAPACPAPNSTDCGHTFDLQIDSNTWVPAAFAKADASSVVLTASTAGKKVTGVRHLWGGWPLAAVYNAEGLPSAPFVSVVA